MKPLLILFFFLFCIPTQAAILHVGVGPAYEYNSFGAAYTTANDGDTIKVNSGNWGNYGIYKPVTIIGTGYQLEENSVSDANEAVFDYLIFYDGSQGSRVIGCYLTDYISTSVTSNININRVSAPEFRISNSDNIIIQNSYFPSYYSYVSTSSNILIKNNFIDNLEVSSNSFAVVKNNTIRNLDAHNSNILNNIIYGNPYIFGAGRNNTTSHNIVIGGIPDPNPDSNNNYYIDWTTAEDLFIGYPEQGSYSNDERWQLSPGSPAIGAADDGGDCGMYGGDNPYTLSGIPPIPTVYELNVPLESNGTNLPLEVKARTNN